ncbi:chemoreceptor glutamine deamidase CheD [Oceanococcus atlanticus]|uniref:Probable chemoreceptor glutamine deamidase CheD n=1 Tax=Oceanococcus atlanticus TaxID=1317117 RepID=A0A1Y1SGT9_9GAMM|nr:chemoreceptor glutamine deamidase CheD [Oceanococcus atlanticus]ORE88883.1 chemoreceptor glutamine deamidase CheD [Oceanococcus atlanticus]
MSALSRACDIPSDSEMLGVGTAHFLYRDRHFRSEAIKVLPGEYYATASDIMIVTLLGSCVAACIHDPQRRIGGMNHFLLPQNRMDDGLAGARYGVHAMELLINGLLQLGARREALEAKVFGGGNVARRMTRSLIGQQNAHFVLAFLERERIRVTAQDMGGDSPRRIHFFPQTGQVMVRTLAVADVPDIELAESALESRVGQPQGGVELFT